MREILSQIDWFYVITNALFFTYGYYRGRKDERNG